MRAHITDLIWTLAVLLLVGGVTTPAAATAADNSSPTIHVRGVNVVTPARERRMRRDIAGRLADRRSALRGCLNRGSETTVTVDWTITTDGEAVDVTAFTDNRRVEGCLTRTIEGLRFASLADRHPRARVELTK